MENIFGLTTCVAIVVIAYLVGIVIKNTDAIDDKWIPAICGIVGAPLGCTSCQTSRPRTI